MKIQTATLIASSLSGLVMAASLLVMANIYVEIQDSWSEFDGEIAEFKVRLR